MGLKLLISAFTMLSPSWIFCSSFHLRGHLHLKAMLPFLYNTGYTSRSDLQTRDTEIHRHLLFIHLADACIQIDIEIDRKYKHPCSVAVDFLSCVCFLSAPLGIRAGLVSLCLSWTTSTSQQSLRCHPRLL